jgi:hypothetical protein
MTVSLTSTVSIFAAATVSAADGRAAATLATAETMAVNNPSADAHASIGLYDQRRKAVRFRLLTMALMATLLAPFWSSVGSRADDFTPGRDAFYVSDQRGGPPQPAPFPPLGTVSKFRVSNGDFQRVLITGTPFPPGHPVTPNGIVVDPVSPPELVVAFQNADTPFNGEIRVFEEATGALKSVLVPDDDPHAPCAPFGILLYNNLLLVADEGGCGPGPGAVEAFDTTTTPATFLRNLDTTGYSNSFFTPLGWSSARTASSTWPIAPLTRRSGSGT